MSGLLFGCPRQERKALMIRVRSKARLGHKTVGPFDLVLQVHGTVLYRTQHPFAAFDALGVNFQHCMQDACEAHRTWYGINAGISFGCHLFNLDNV